jgi:hypothetical protein
LTEFWNCNFAFYFFVYRYSTMSSRLSYLSMLLAQKRVEDAMKYIDGYQNVVSSVLVPSSGARRLIQGTVLHIAKSKKLSFSTRSNGEKKLKRDGNYLRLIFCR